MSVSVKAFLNTSPPEIRRFQLPVDVSTCYDYLHSKISDVYPSLRVGNFKLYWTDVDGDEIRFSGDDELMMAMSARVDDTFRVYIKVVGDKDGMQDTPNWGKPQGSQHPEGQQSGGQPHPGVQCDMCDKLICGTRYKCCVCPDYDLCGECEQTGVHSEHFMLRITSPMQGGFPGAFHQAFMGPMFNNLRRGGRRHPFCHRGDARSQRPGGACGRPCGAAGGAWQCPPDPTNIPPGAAHGEEFLKNVGEGISNFLGSFGVDVHYDVEHGGPRTCPRGRCPTETPPTAPQHEGMEAEGHTAGPSSTDPASQTDEQPATSEDDAQSTSGAQADPTPEATQTNTDGSGGPFTNQQEVIDSMTRAMNLLASMGFKADGQQK